MSEQKVKKSKSSKTPIDIPLETYIQDLDNIQTYKVRINYVEDDAVVVNLNGWSKRIYFDLSFDELEYIRNNKNAYTNKFLTINYIGDILNAFTVNILPIKSLEYITGNIY